MESSSGGETEMKLNLPSSLPSPNSSSSSSSASIPATRSDPNNTNNNPYPTTFVQADATSFKQVVQMLTSSLKTVKQEQQTNSIPPLKSVGRNHHHHHQQQEGFKLYERRNSVTNGLKISPLSSKIGLNPYRLPGRKPEMILSLSMLDFPSLILGPVTPLMADRFNKAPNSNSRLDPDSGRDWTSRGRRKRLRPMLLPKSQPKGFEPKRLRPVLS